MYVYSIVFFIIFVITINGFFFLRFVFSSLSSLLLLSLKPPFLHYTSLETRHSNMNFNR